MYNTVITENTSYKYLGVILDNHLTLNDHISKISTKVFNRTSLLARIRPNISQYVAGSIYNTMINPILFYCYPALIALSDTNCNKLQKLKDRATKVITTELIELNIPSLKTLREQRVAIDVFKSLNNIGPQLENLTFQRIAHGKNTRGNGSQLLLPKVKTKAGRKTSLFNGTKIYNSLNKNLRDEKSVILFKRKIKEFLT